MVTLSTVPQMLEVRTVIFLSNLHIAVTTKNFESANNRSELKSRAPRMNTLQKLTFQVLHIFLELQVMTPL